MAQNDTKKREKAAQLIVEDALSDDKIAEQVQISRSTLVRWKANPGFMARVDEVACDYAKRTLRHGIARKERRVAVLNNLHEKLLEVISERSETPDLSDVPGGKTGLVVKTLKGLGSGDNFKVVEEYEVDCATVREIRALQEQVAEEVGQRVSRAEMLDLNRLFEKMTREELEAYAREGNVPAWFPSGTQ